MKAKILPRNPRAWREIESCSGPMKKQEPSKHSGEVRPASIAEYIDAAPHETRKKLREMCACIRKAAPGAKESLKWGMPAFSYGRILVTFAAYKKHIGFYPTPSAVKAFSKDLVKFATSSSAIQFPLEKPLPLALIGKITAFRVRESLEKDGKWRT
jgi:uncharacterized protein YdhG (YjbR/CyaY superfamily)